MFSRLQKNQRVLTVLSFFCLLLLVQYAFLSTALDLRAIFINFLLVLPLFGLLLLLTGRSPLALALLSLLLYLFYYLDCVVYSARLTHIRYSDLFAVKDALRVAGGYAFPFTAQNALRLLIVLFVVGFLFLLGRVLPGEQSRKENRLVGGLTLLLSLALIVGGSASGWLPTPVKTIDDNFDANGLVNREGLYYTLYGQYRNSRLQAPDGYSPQKAEEVLSRYSGDAPAEEAEAVRVIVVMNEALADYSLLGTPQFDDPLVELHDPENAFFEGKLAVSVFGGYTCNTEFEFLTGCTMQFLPQDYIPFSQLIVSDMPSFAREMKELGMSADGVHPYYSQEWNRRQVYSFLGFDRLIAGEDFSSGLEGGADLGNVTNTQLKPMDFGADLEYIRGFISDAEAYRKTGELLDAQADGGFIFLVTVQNHGGYHYTGEDFTATAYIPGQDTLNQYLTCSAISDAAFKQFIDELSQDSRKTIVLMFGDHQPGLDFSGFVDGLSSVPYAEYYVPYIVWSNFALQGELPEVTSANYLSAILKQCAGLPLSAWDRLRLGAMESYPVMTGHFVLDRDLQPVDALDDSSRLLQDYAIVQYDRIRR